MTLNRLYVLQKSIITNFSMCLYCMTVLYYHQDVAYHALNTDISQEKFCLAGYNGSIGFLVTHTLLYYYVPFEKNNHTGPT